MNAITPERFAHKGRLTPSGAMWFGPREETDIEGALNRSIDAALEVGNANEVPRSYLGGSRLGVECQRALAYEWHENMRHRARYDADPEAWLKRPNPTSPFKGKTVRRFRMGHMHENETADWLRKAGFDLRTEKADGHQFGFNTLHDRQSGRARIGGHVDGILLSGPVPLPFPLLWENKIMVSTKWKAGRDKGLKSEFPVYYAQMQVYMGFSGQFYGGDGLKNCLFTALNTDTSELWFEIVPFNERDFEWALRRGEEVVQSESPEPFKRISSDPAFWKCRFCSYREPCHAPPEVGPGAEAPAWVTGRELA